MQGHDSKPTWGATGRAADEMVELPRLTARELQVLRLVAGGHSSASVAAVLGIRVRTAETHRRNLMAKLGVHSAVELTLLALRRGLT
jgi:NarL family two-component system response regulator LiaR